MGLNVLQSIKRVGLALAVLAASAFAIADGPPSGTVVQWGYAPSGTGLRNVVACGSASNFYGEVNVFLMKDGTVTMYRSR